MKTIKVSEATNTQLDWLVAKCTGGKIDTRDGLFLNQGDGYEYFTPTTDPAQMWPIIEREKISTLACDLDWEAQSRTVPLVAVEGPTSLIAAARCYVASKLGEEVEVPDALA